MKAWLFQDHRQKAKLGDDCPWSVGCYDPDGKRKGKPIGSKSAAEKYQRKIEGQLAAGVYENLRRKPWADFEEEFEAKVMAGMKPGTRDATQYALNHLNRIIKPGRMAAITSSTIADYVGPPTRRRKASEESPAGFPGDDQQRIADAPGRCLRKANRWGYLANASRIRLSERTGQAADVCYPGRLRQSYAACDVGPIPAELPTPAADWWRGLLTMAYMTGWRIGSLLALRWQQVDLKAGTAISLAGDNKGSATR